MGRDQERRLHPRVPFHRLVQYRFDTLGELRCDYAENVSEGGLLVRAETARTPGTMVNVQFVAQGADTLAEALGRVVHVVPRERGTCALGVELVNTDEDYVAAIRAAVEQHENDENREAQ
jgi:hypothetical protein